MARPGHNKKRRSRTREQPIERTIDPSDPRFNTALARGVAVLRAFELDEMVNFVTPGFATAAYVSSQSVQRIRTTAESHRRIAIIEVMGRDCGMIALGTAFGQPDVILVPEVPVDPGAEAGAAFGRRYRRAEAGRGLTTGVA